MGELPSTISCEVCGGGHATTLHDDALKMSNPETTSGISVSEQVGVQREASHLQKIVEEGEARDNSKAESVRKRDLLVFLKLFLDSLEKGKKNDTLLLEFRELRMDALKKGEELKFIAEALKVIFIDVMEGLLAKPGDFGHGGKKLASTYGELRSEISDQMLREFGDALLLAAAKYETCRENYYNAAVYYRQLGDQEKSEEYDQEGDKRMDEETYGNPRAKIDWSPFKEELNRLLEKIRTNSFFSRQKRDELFDDLVSSVTKKIESLEEAS